MSAKVVLYIINLARDENVRKFIGGLILGIFLFIFLPIVYFFITNPLQIGIKPAAGDYEIVQSIAPDITQQQFLDLVSPEAIEGQKDYKIFASITMAQAILESGWGNSGLSQKANNLFGIKAFNWTGASVVMKTKEYYDGMEVTVDASFRVYSTPQESVKDHSQFLVENSTYKENGVFDATTCEQQAEALQRAGYATDPNYPSQLIKLIRQYNLQQYDTK